MVRLKKQSTNNEAVINTTVNLEENTKTQKQKKTKKNKPKSEPKPKEKREPKQKKEKKPKINKDKKPKINKDKKGKEQNFTKKKSGLFKKASQPLIFDDSIENMFARPEYYGNEINNSPKSNIVKKKKQHYNILNALIAITKYDNTFNPTKYWLICIASFAVILALCFVFRLSIIFMAIVLIADIICTPQIILAITRNKYEEMKFNEVTGYIEQVLYSFRKNSKILTSLYDAAVVFPTGLMHSCIEKATQFIRTGQTDSNIYEEGLKVIEDEFDCRRIKSLHRYLVKVEGVGGDHNMGIEALLNDRRLWVERKDDFRKERSSVIKGIIFSALFSTGIILFVLYKLPENDMIMANLVARIVSTIYIIANMIAVTLSFTQTINFLNDVDSESYEALLIKRVNWYKSFNIARERRLAIKPATICIIVAMGGILMSNKWLSILGVLAALFMYIAFPMVKYRNTKKSLITEVERAYPDWLLGLSLLLQTDNLHVALEKTIETAPAILKQDLRKLSDDIMAYPNEVKPYADFLSYLPVEDIHSSMRLLYSISEFGSEEEEKQISELIQRNASLMNKAEKSKTKGKLAIADMLKFIPMATSSITLIVEMTVFITVFMNNIMSQAF